MPPVFKLMAAASLAAAYLVTSRADHWQTSAFVKTALAGWTALLLAWGLWHTQLYPRFFSPLRHLPEPDGNSFWHGQFKRIRAEPSGVPMLDWIHSVPNDGLIRYKGIFNGERLLPASPKALAEVLVTRNYDFEKPPLMRTTIGRLLGVGILLAEGEEHKAQRRSLGPAFAYRHVKDLYATFWDKSREAVQTMTAQIIRDCKDGSKTTAIEAGGWASRATLDIIGVAGLGRDFGAIKDPENELFRTYSMVFAPSAQMRALGLLREFLPGWLVNAIPVRRNHDIGAAVRTLRATCRSLIAEKKQLLREKKGDAPVDILSVALQSGGFSDDNLVDQLMTFLAAGHETTASAMTWAAYMLARNQDVQARLRAEVRERLPSLESGESITSADVDGMPYLNAVCMEVLRYLSPVPMTTRQAARDTTILGHHVPKGTRIFLPIWAINKSRALWGDDAGEFKPERWLNGKNDGGASSNYALMTFLHGPRSCIGMGFAKAEFACLLAAWIGRFELELVNKEEMDEANVSIKGGITTRPEKGMHVYARVVEGW